jgi:hypothetical protein
MEDGKYVRYQEMLVRFRCMSLPRCEWSKQRKTAAAAQRKGWMKMDQKGRDEGKLELHGSPPRGLQLEERK